MSSEEFFGRPISRGMEDIEFDLCEICQRRSPNWLEVQYQDGVPVVRFSCQECHEQYIDSSDVMDEDIARQISDDEEIEETVRPGWVDDFIKEGGESLETISSQPVTPISDQEEEEEEKGNLGSIPDETSEPTINFSEAPDTFRNVEERPEEEEFERRPIASWTSEFIQEALFGSNPESWLNNKGAYNADKIKVTISTLGSFVGHDVSSVKLSAIQCLLGAYNRNSDKKKLILEELQRYQKDSDETIKEFAESTISQIK